MPEPGRSSEIIDRNCNWPYRPEALLREIASPGSTHLEGVLPYEQDDQKRMGLLEPDQGVLDLNNFHLKVLPSCRYWSFPKVEDDSAGLTYGQREVAKAEESSAVSRKLDPYTFGGYSLRRINSSPEQFRDDIDLTVEQTGLTKTIAALDHDYPGGHFDEAGLARWKEAGRQIYLAMRAKGYSHRDLA